MRILQTHVDFIEYEPVEKEIRSAEDVEKKKYTFENGVVLFTSVENGDDESLVRNAVGDLKQSLKNLKVNKVLIYPFAHLSTNLARPDDALKICKSLEAAMREAGFHVSRAPFGWNKAFQLKVKGHPLAEQSKVYSSAKQEMKKVEHVERKSDRSLLRRSDFAGLPEDDHRIIGQKLDLFSFQEVAPGMVFWHDAGLTLRNLLVDFWRNEHRKAGYQEISTPLILNNVTWEVSGHWDHYKNNMFFTKIDDATFGLKPMNCPGAILVYKTRTRSYKDLPLRLGEIGLVHRNELSGVLSGLFRVRAATQDDAHIFIAPEQLEKELKNVVDLINHFYKTFGFSYHVELSTRPEDAMGSKEIWNKAEGALENALKKLKIKYKLNRGEGAFYGPKIDFHIKDSQGRTWQCATVQVDFQMPERFEINYVGEDGKGHRPVIIHRVIYGSLERFIGILIEHYKGKFPIWLSPVQAIVLSISNENNKYGQKILKELLENGIRVEGNFETNTIEYKIRESQLQKIPYMIVVGSKEEKSKTLAVRDRDTGKTKFGVKLEDFLEELKEQVEKEK